VTFINVKYLIGTKPETISLILFTISARNITLKPEPTVNCNGESSRHTFLSPTAVTRTCFAHTVGAICVLLTGFMWRIKEPIILIFNVVVSVLSCLSYIIMFRYLVINKTLYWSTVGNYFKMKFLRKWNCFVVPQIEMPIGCTVL
jgi:hypothetical protein